MAASAARPMLAMADDSKSDTADCGRRPEARDQIRETPNRHRGRDKGVDQVLGDRGREALLERQAVGFEQPGLGRFGEDRARAEAPEQKRRGAVRRRGGARFGACDVFRIIVARFIPCMDIGGAYGRTKRLAGAMRSTIDVRGRSAREVRIPSPRTRRPSGS